MFESAELGHKIDKKTYNREEPPLREQLLNCQYELLAASEFPVLIIIGGVDGAGKGETVNLLNEWMDPRHIITEAFGAPTQEELERPRFYRFWNRLPPKGHIGILFGSWYTVPIINRVIGKTKDNKLDADIEEIVRFEKMLTDEGVLILKFWFHLSKEQQKKRLKALEANPKTRWRITDTDWERFKNYDKFRRVSEHSLRKTSTGNAPWIVVEGTDPNFRALTVGQSLLKTLRARLDAPHPQATTANIPQIFEPVDNLHLLQTLDMGEPLGKKEYKEELEKWQGNLNQLSRHPEFKNISLLTLFEGNDAAGKGSTIRRVTQALDARHYHIVPVAAPTDEELAQPYLWRFWRHLPRRGAITIFDRSWYGRVLVERVEGYCAESDWMRAYAEINDFEEQLVDHRIIVLKFWLAITKEEQLARFKLREETPHKQFKITEEDWRNREKWTEYEHAVCDMVDRTSTEYAPWHVIPSNDKKSARIRVLKTYCECIEAALEQ